MKLKTATLALLLIACGDSAPSMNDAMVDGSASADSSSVDSSRADSSRADSGEVSDAGADTPVQADVPSVDASVDPADWAERSSAEGVTMATNFETSADVFDFAVDDASHYEWANDIRRSGAGALRILIGSEDGTSGWDWWRPLDDSMEPFGSAEDGLRDEYWLSYRVYIPEEYFGWIFDCGGSKKFSITSGHPVNSVNPITREPFSFPLGADRRTGSSVANEVVIDDSSQTMWVTLYRQAGGRSAERMNSFSGEGCSRFDFAWANTIDHGVQSGTPLAFPGDERSQECRDWNAQFGPSYVYGNVNGGVVTGQPRSAGPVPHPDPLAGEERFRVGWNTVMYHIRFPRTWTGTEGGILELFIHHDGDDDWVQIMERRDDFVMNDPSAVSNGIEANGGVDGYFHWGLWLTPFRTGGQPEPDRPDTFVVYDEVLVSTSPIAAPAL